MEEVNKELVEYIDMNVFPRYDANNVGGHGISHIKTVISRCFELIRKFNLDVDHNMIYTVAAYHDIGYRTNPDKHEQISSEMFYNDINMERFFDDGSEN